MLQLPKKIDILCALWRSNCMLFSRSYPKLMPLKHQHPVWVRSASALPRCNNGIKAHCYVWVPQMPIIPKCNDGSLIYYYVWVQYMLITPKCNNGSLIYVTFGYDWCRSYPNLTFTEKCKIFVRKTPFWFITS